jgi:hypothetical protein
MRFQTGVTLAAICFAATTSAAIAKPSGQPVTSAASRQNPVASVRAPLQVQSGQKQQIAQPFKPLQFQVSPHKPEGAASPAPLATPEFNPLKRRHMAMPGIPEPDLAF